ncbi:MAG: hypothetical protein Q8M23_00460 [Bacteroidales bacterium]|nr:hypothetical protein [Bacteroidales bacterium]
MKIESHTQDTVYSGLKDGNVWLTRGLPVAYPWLTRQTAWSGQTDRGELKIESHTQDTVYSGLKDGNVYFGFTIEPSKRDT